MPPLIATILGACPQFVKAAPVSPAFRRAGIEERVLHTGQNYNAKL
jgi:UDP-N-acetylglucosamine 2-epimerase